MALDEVIDVCTSVTIVQLLLRYASLLQKCVQTVHFFAIQRLKFVIIPSDVR